jgi:hypothetical protein
MNTTQTLKWGQIAGFGLMACGVWGFVKHDDLNWPLFMLAGALVLAGFRIALWVRG